jgi:hypothetical protein
LFSLLWCLASRFQLTRQTSAIDAFRVWEAEHARVWSASCAADRTDVPLRNWSGFALHWNWTYDAIKKLVLAGLTDRAVLNTKPMTRSEMARVVAQAIAKITGDEGGKYADRQDLAVATLFFAIRQSLRIALGCFAVMAILLQGVIGQVYQLTAEFRSVAPLATRILEHLHANDLLVHEGPLENSAGLPFYTGRQVHVVDGQRGDLHFGSRFPEAKGLFLGGEEFARLWQGRHRIFFVTDRPGDEGILRLSRHRCVISSDMRGRDGCSRIGQSR